MVEAVVMPVAPVVEIVQPQSVPSVEWLQMVICATPEYFWIVTVTGVTIMESQRPFSSHGGVYNLTVSPGEGELYPVIVEVIAGQTIDEDDGLAVTNGYFMEALPGRWGFVSPLTTMVALEGEKSIPVSTSG